MSSSQNKRNRSIEVSRTGVLCAYCEHLNPKGIQKCEDCSRDLFVDCVNCGQPNVRARSRCQQCGRPLPSAGPGEKLKRQIKHLKRRQILAGVLFAIIFLGAVWYVAFR